MPKLFTLVTHQSITLFTFIACSQSLVIASDYYHYNPPYHPDTQKTTIMHYTSVLLAGLSLRHYVYAAPSPLAALPLLNTVDTTIGQAGSTVKSATNSVTNLLGSDLVSKRAGLDLETVPTLVDSVVDAPLSIPGHGIGGIALFPKKTLASALKKYAGLETKVFGQVDAIAGIVAKDVSKGCVPAVQVALNSIIASLQGFISLDLNVPVVGLVVSDVNVILDLTNVVDLVVKDVVGCVETLKVSLAAGTYYMPFISISVASC